MNTCGTCVWWNFKLGGLPDGKEWGECINPKYYESTRVSARHVHVGPEVLNGIENYARVQHEEKTFGCIYHEAVPQTADNP